MRVWAIAMVLFLAASTGLGAAEGGPSRPFFAQMVLQGVTFQVESPNDSSINPVTVRALAGENKFSEERMEADGTIPASRLTTSTRTATRRSIKPSVKGGSGDVGAKREKQIPITYHFTFWGRGTRNEKVQVRKAKGALR